jgi:NIPSNAP
LLFIDNRIVVVSVMIAADPSGYLSGIGESSNELTYMLPWESLADRETRWTAFQNDPAWHKVRDDSERDGPIVASISNQILTPTPFSQLK